MPDIDPHSAKDSGGQPGLVPAALFGLCPQCGARSLFDGVIRFAPRCRSCGLDFARFNVGDGPAVFITLIVGAVIVGLAIWVETAFAPPLWVHIVLWTPLILAASLWGLRVGKAAMLTAEFQQDAGEGTTRK
jgi:uncharacterized protein (DUF983 family)